MRDRHFMEDENELPYLVWETRDNKKRNTSQPMPSRLDFKDIPFREFPTYVKRLIISPHHKENIINSVKSNRETAHSPCIRTKMKSELHSQ